MKKEQTTSHRGHREHREKPFVETKTSGSIADVQRACRVPLMIFSSSVFSVTSVAKVFDQ